jgi:hypothetical protein
MAGVNFDQTEVLTSPLAGCHGFTSVDLSVLQEACASIERQRWGRAQIVTNAFSDYLAVWKGNAAEDQPPSLSVVRFKKTGTYALLIGMTVAANGKSLQDVLPALGASLAVGADNHA